MRPSSFIPFRPPSASPRATQGAADFLRAHDRIAPLLSAVARLAALQEDCSRALPAMFAQCTVLQLDAEGQMTVAVPNAALAARLKQQLPKLQAAMLQQGWQVKTIRLKVQIGKIAEKPAVRGRQDLPAHALSAFAALRTVLDDSPRNQALKDAVDSLLRRRAGR